MEIIAFVIGILGAEASAREKSAIVTRLVENMLD